MEQLVVLRGVREITEAAKPDAPHTVTQRAFDAERARSPEHAGLPRARRIAEQLGVPWREVLTVAHAPSAKQSQLLGRKRGEAYAQDWLTPDYVATVLKLVARRLGKRTLTPGEYRAEREAMLSQDRARWLHGRQLVLPNDDQIRAAVSGAARGTSWAGSWDAALRLAGLTTTHNATRTKAIKQTILSRVDVIERFHDHYGEKPSAHAVEAFARGNGLPMSSEHGGTWADTFAEWEAARRDRGDPPARVVRRVGRGHKAPDYSANVGAARPGEHPYKRKWANPDDCAAWVKRYLDTLGAGQRSTVRGYDDWAREQTGAPRASVFGKHGGWEAIRRRAQGQARST